MKLWHIYIVLILSGVFLTWTTTLFLVSDSLYFNSLSSQFTYEQIQDLLDKSKKWAWLGYAIIPLVYLIKCSLVALCLEIGLFLFTNRFVFGRMFKVALLTEFIFFIPSLIKLLWFLFVKTDYTLQDLQFFYPLAALNFFDHNTLEPWLMYPLQILNFFELVYWIVLAWGITREFPELDMNRSMSLVATGYGSGLLVWVAIVMFVSLTYG